MNNKINLLLYMIFRIFNLRYYKKKSEILIWDRGGNFSAIYLPSNHFFQQVHKSK